jgi:hypothetical protein
MDAIFNAINKEAQFTLEMLCAGYTQIRNANLARKGIYFQAFTSLSTGFERIGKIILLLDYAINNNNNFPDLTYMKEEIGHDIYKIYNNIVNIKNKYNFVFEHIQELNESIYIDILQILSRFSKGDRYSNIDLIVNVRNYNDPISEWYDKIDKYIIENKINKYKINKIMNEANLVQKLISDIASVHFTDEKEKEVNTPYEMYLKNNINNLVGPYRQLYVYHISRYFVEMLINIEHCVREKGKITIPDFWEIFRIFNCDDSLAKNRKVLKS